MSKLSARIYLRGPRRRSALPASNSPAASTSHPAAWWAGAAVLGSRRGRRAWVTVGVAVGGGSSVAVGGVNVAVGVSWAVGVSVGGVRLRGGRVVVGVMSGPRPGVLVTGVLVGVAEGVNVGVIC